MSEVFPQVNARKDRADLDEETDYVSPRKLLPDFTLILNMETAKIKEGVLRLLLGAQSQEMFVFLPRCDAENIISQNCAGARCSNRAVILHYITASVASVTLWDFQELSTQLHRT